MNITLRQLEIFAAIALHGHVGKAAETLGISQSAASMALSDFEKVLGELLFDRVSRSLLLNERGRVLLPRAIAVLEQVRAIEEETKGGAGSGRIRVGASTTIGNYLLPGILGSFAVAEPGIAVSLEVANTSEIAARLAAHAIDVALVEGPVNGSEIVATFWRKDELVPFAGPRMAAPSADTMEWIMREPGSGTREVFERAMADAALPVRVRMELGHTEAIKKAVEAGLGFGCLSRLAVERELALGYLVPFSMPGTDFHRDLSILLLRNKYLTAPLSRFLAFCRNPDQ
ncbi:MAG TPA: LysR substrate-binding domain-containing protein [Spirochaetia bacterium]|nr:LysR substrate-binding domain-containing protein [Spirochaetia bacterium]